MDFQHQYEFVKSSREALLAYCQTISDENFILENSLFGRGSIRNLLVHIGNTYEFWIGKHGLNKAIHFTAYHAVKDAFEAREYFLNIDALIDEFILAYSGNHLQDLELTIKDRTVVVSPLKLFTHVITHEFHHKGQILSLSRHIGYVPIDTDVIR
jgi:uncharacterized damage-inducible protein DinB